MKIFLNPYFLLQRRDRLRLDSSFLNHRKHVGTVHLIPLFWYMRIEARYQQSLGVCAKAGTAYGGTCGV